MIRCDGCASASNPKKCGVTNEMVQRLTMDITCPCSDCLVKMMCQKGCKAYHVFWDKLFLPIEE